MKKLIRSGVFISTFAALFHFCSAPALGQLAPPGGFVLSPMGGVSYSVPLQLPQGAGKVTPSLSLSYSNQLPKGISATGWGVDGLSVISRCGRNVADDSVKGSVNFDAFDRFCVDGSRLMAVSGADGDDGSQYFSSMWDGARYRGVGAANGTDGTAYFEKVTREGLTYTYGYDANARILGGGRPQAAYWLLQSVRDLTGNVANYQYNVGDRSISTISYAGGVSIQFAYEPRPDPAKVYVFGAELTKSSRLKTISITVAGNAVAEYKITYEVKSPRGDSYLKSITYCTPSGGCLPARAFSWKAPVDGFAALLNSAPGGVFGGLQSDARVDAGRFADVNGDGLLDYTVVWSNGGARSIAVYLSQRDGTFANVMNSAPGGSFSASADESLLDVGQFLDLNKDGLSDYVVVWNNGGNRNIAVYLAKSDGTFEAMRNSTPGGPFSPRKSNAQQEDSGTFADVNGDGLPDYIVSWMGSGSRNLTVYLNNGNGTFANLINSNVGGSFVWSSDGDRRDTGTWLDVNGDGAADYVVVWNNNGQRNIASYLSKRDGSFYPVVNSAPCCNFLPTADDARKDIGEFADVNGDGIPDHVFIWNNGGNRNIAAALGLGDGRFEVIKNSAPGGTFGASKADVRKDIGLFRDVNGDGLADYVVVWNNAGGRNFAVYLSKGDGFYFSPINSIPGGVFESIVSDPLVDIGRFEDVNQDGAMDYVVVWSYNGVRNIAVYYGKSDGTFASLTNSAPGGSYSNAPSGARTDVGSFVDLNGDGLLDYVVVWNNGGARNIAGTLLSSSAVNELVSVSEADVQVQRFTYQTLSQALGSAYVRGSSVPGVQFSHQTIVGSSIKLLQSVESLANTGAYKKTIYKYGNLTLANDVKGGVRGFEWTEVKDENTGLVSRMSYHLDFPFVGLIKRATQGFDGGVDNLSQTSYRYGCYDFDQTLDCQASPGKRYFVYQNEMEETAKDLKGTALPGKRTETVYDCANAPVRCFGNAIKVTIKTLDASGNPTGHVKETVSDFYNDETSWRLGKLLRSKVISTAP